MVAGAGLPRPEPMGFNCQAGASGLQWEAGARGPNQPWRCEAGGSASEAGAASSGQKRVTEIRGPALTMTVTKIWRSLLNGARQQQRQQCQEEKQHDGQELAGCL